MALGEPGQGVFYHPSSGWEAFGPIGPASPQRCGGRGDGTCRQLQPYGLWGLLYPLSRHRFWAFSPVRVGCATTTCSKICSSSLVSWTLTPATTTLKGPLLPSTRTLRLLPALARSVGWVRQHPPKTGLAHSTVFSLPFPVNPAQFFASFHQYSPDGLQHSQWR